MMKHEANVSHWQHQKQRNAKTAASS